MRDLIAILYDLVNSEAYKETLKYIRLITPQFGPLIEYGGTCVDNTHKLTEYTTMAQTFIASYDFDPTLEIVSINSLAMNSQGEYAIDEIKKYIKKTIKAILKMHDADDLIIDDLDLEYTKGVIENTLRVLLDPFKKSPSISSDNVFNVLNSLLEIYESMPKTQML